MLSLKNLILEADDYRGEHEAPDKSNGSPLHDLTGIYPDNIYSEEAARHYGDNGGDSKDHYSISIIKYCKGKPNQPVKIYRAIPNLYKELEDKIKNFNYLLYYVDKFGFPPMDNKAPKNVYIDLGFTYQNVQYDKSLFIAKVTSKIKELENSKGKRLRIDPGNWVTINKEYAIEHGNDNLKKKYKILTKTVPAKHLYTDGNSIHEWGYDPS